MIRRCRAHREICRRLLDRLAIVQDDLDWPPSENYERRRLPENVHELVNDLVEECGEEQLLGSGLAARDREGALTASLRLAPSGAIVIPLFQSADWLPVDVLLPDGLLLGDEALPYVAVHDYRLAAAIGSSNRVLLAVPTLEDVLTCQALGLAAVPFAGMDCLDLIELRQLEEVTRARIGLRWPEAPEETADDERSSAGVGLPPEVRDPGATEPQAMEHPGLNHDPAVDAPSDDGLDIIGLAADDLLPVELIIAGWSFWLQERVPQEQIQRAILRLANAWRFLSIDVSGVAVWVPNPGHMERISFCWELRDREAVRSAVLTSIGEACYSVSAAASGAIGPWQTPSTYLEARSALSRGLRAGESAPVDRSELAEVFERLLQRQIIDPLLEGGVNHGDPVVGALRMELANISSLLQSQAPFLQHDLMQAGIRVKSRDKRGTLENSIRIRMQLVDRLIRIVRELRR